MSEFITIGEPITTFASTQPDVSMADAVDFKKIVGGAELNVAIGVSRLGHSTEYISRVGPDPLGEFVKNEITANHVGADYVTFDDYYWTAFQLKDKVTKGDPKTYNFRRNSAATHLSADIIDKVDLSDVKIAHMSGIFPAISKTAQDSFRRLFKCLNAQHIFTTFDPNLRPSLWPDQATMAKTLNELATYADVVMPGDNEGQQLIGSKDPETIADFYLKADQTKTVIVKIGAKGAYVKNKGEKGYYVDGFKAAHVVDTVGAGDGFALGFITAMLEGKSQKSAVMRGNAVGCLQVQTPGDNDGYPTQKELANFYAAQGVEETNEITSSH
ncbi:MAG: sugar kinase [Oenococcus sp.]|uniref:sugar kinase n=1 Tax=Oenococcus sp. TaxID=1979414 RepID=UPI0039ED47ED